ncbi:DUF4199 domain-containing protein [Dokdonia genika]|uniref:DUF4199 domain-containing protein n=1 Tax=Dokdonia genika TaxID=308113 RepID=A0ABV9LBZ4_9FLAO
MKIETTNTTTIKDVMIKFGVVLGVISILFNVVLYVTDNFLAPHWSLGVLNFVITIIIIVMALKAFKQGNGGFMKLGQSIKIGLGVSLIAALLGGIWLLILTQVLEPNYSELALDAARDQIIEMYPDMSDAQLDQSISFQEPFTKISFMLPVAIMMSLFFGFIISLIAGLILKKENPHADA